MYYVSAYNYGKYKHDKLPYKHKGFPDQPESQMYNIPQKPENKLQEHPSDNKYRQQVYQEKQFKHGTLFLVNTILFRYINILKINEIRKFYHKYFTLKTMFFLLIFSILNIKNKGYLYLNRMVNLSDFSVVLITGNKDSGFLFYLPNHSNKVLLSLMLGFYWLKYHGYS